LVPSGRRVGLPSLVGGRGERISRTRDPVRTSDPVCPAVTAGAQR
jgi:hypothetical protein